MQQGDGLKLLMETGFEGCAGLYGAIKSCSPACRERVEEGERESKKKPASHM